MKRNPRPKACGHEDCSISTGFAEDELTFGRGELDDYGYWEFPCYPCAMRWKSEHPKELVWPETPEQK